MRKFFYIFGLFTVIAVIILSLMGCSTDINSDNNPKSIKVENITGWNSYSEAGIWIFKNIPSSGYPQNTALRYGPISNNSLNFELSVPGSKGNTFESNTKWTGKGDFYIILVPVSGNTFIPSEIMVYTDGTISPAKVTISQALTTLDFGKFKKYSEL